MAEALLVPLSRNSEEKREKRAGGGTGPLPPLRRRRTQRGGLHLRRGQGQRLDRLQRGGLHGAEYAVDGEDGGARRAQDHREPPPHRIPPQRAHGQRRLQVGARGRDAGAVLGGLQQARLQAELRHLRRAARPAEPRAVGRDDGRGGRGARTARMDRADDGGRRPRPREHRLGDPPKGGAHPRRALAAARARRGRRRAHGALAAAHGGGGHGGGVRGAAALRRGKLAADPLRADGDLR